jgi:hypothetical protein
MEQRNQTVVGMARSMMKAKRNAGRILGGGGEHGDVHPQPCAEEPKGHPSKHGTGGSSTSHF